MAWPTATVQIDTGEEIDKTEPADIIIMNPPFTRDSLRHDQFSKREETKLKAREKELFKKKPTYMAGQSGAFLLLGEWICNRYTGTIAAVIPLAAATAISGAETRKFLAREFHIETIIASQDPERVYFSENTDIGEALLICRRWTDAKGPKPATKIVNLARNPSTPSEARTVAQIIESERVEEEGYGTIQFWPRQRIVEGDWNGVQFLQPYLCDKYTRLKNGNIFDVTVLETLAEIGPEGRRIRDAFVKSTMPDAFGRTALWDHDTEMTQSIETKTDTNIRMKPNPKEEKAKEKAKKEGRIIKTREERLGDSYWEKRSRVLLPNRIRLNTVRALCVRLPNPALGSAWSPCRIKPTGRDTESIEKALVVYLNSSLGVLAMAGNRTSKDISYPRFSLSDLRGLIVPDFRVLDEEVVNMLAREYDTQATADLKHLSEMNECDTRIALDQAVSDALGINREEIEAIRRNLVAEPAVTNKRYGA